MRCLWSVGERVGSRAKRPLIQILNFDLIRKLVLWLTHVFLEKLPGDGFSVMEGPLVVTTFIGPRPGHLKSPCTPG